MFSAPNPRNAVLPVSITLSSQLTNCPSSAGRNVSDVTSATTIDILMETARLVLTSSAFTFTAWTLALGLLLSDSTPQSVRHLPCKLGARRVPDRPLPARAETGGTTHVFGGLCICDPRGRRHG